MVPQAKVYNIQLSIRFQKLFSNDVKTLCRIEDKGFCESLNISLTVLGETFLPLEVR